MQEIFKSNGLKKEDARVLFKVDPTKVDTVYDMVMKKLGNLEEAPTVQLMLLSSLPDVTCQQIKSWFCPLQPQLKVEAVIESTIVKTEIRVHCLKHNKAFSQIVKLWCGR